MTIENREVAVAATPEALRFPLESAALFLDFDGTLIDIAVDPSAIRVPERLPRLLADLRAGLGGALAVLSGRNIAALDLFLGEGGFDAAGLHGFQRRRAGVAETAPDADVAEAVDKVRRRLGSEAHAFDVEDKGSAIALHYRRRPSQASDAEAFAQAAVAGSRGLLRMQSGKFVAEIAPAGVSKGQALLRFMAEAPYRGRRPVMMGDDSTDEAAFAAAQDIGGVGVKIGPGPTLAALRLAAPADVRDMLALSERSGFLEFAL